MAQEEQKVAKEEETVEQSTVAKTDFDNLAKEYRRVIAAYNKLLTLVANEYAEKISKSIFEEIDKTTK